MKPGPVLVVDDEEAFRELLVEALEVRGYQAYGAPTAEAALEGWERWNPAVVVTDQNMPGGRTGLDLCTHLRTSAPRVPCIIMTGYGSPDLVARAKRAGAFGFLSKPFKLGEFEASLHRALDWAAHQGAGAP